eukprot:CAMPEP_0194267132 /NCGR_PEP_ID=MMETSP0169-20130528/1769_1 /TAXON_ID=218684 /ORGANISM="Corethron pennatum, Strain L29A3" /LENGTH=471 /DNA_ID=CAMNT_0039007941 /DNA_START=64 /DNA_END=1479 /DNA_ORIENTATION=-
MLRLFICYLLVFIGTITVVSCDEQQAVSISAANTSTNKREWKLHRLDLQKYPLATCLDGSPGAYYIRPGTATGPEINSKVFLHMEGGAWCYDNASCYERSKSHLGSTVDDTDDALSWANAEAYWSMDETVNPAVWDWTSVFIRYCDGASLSGLREEPIVISKNDGTETQIFSRGNFILQAIINELFSESSDDESPEKEDRNRKPSSVKQHLIVSGNSAGGLASFLHAHQFAEAINPNHTQMVVVTDSSFFREDDKNSYLTRRSYVDMIKSVFEMSHAKKSLPLACIEKYQGDNDDKDEAFKCMFAANVIPYINAPLLILQPRYDSYQTEFFLGYNHDDAVTNKDVVNQYGSNLKEELMTALNRQRMFEPKSKVFLSSCEFHTALGGWSDTPEDLNSVWLKAAVDGTTMNVAMDEWLKQVLLPLDENYHGNNIGNRNVLESESDWVAEDLFPCASCCDNLLHKESIINNAVE